MYLKKEERVDSSTRKAYQLPLGMTHWTPNIEKAKGDNLGATTQVTNVAESLIHLQIQHQSKLISLLATITQ